MEGIYALVDAIKVVGEQLQILNSKFNDALIYKDDLTSAAFQVEHTSTDDEPVSTIQECLDEIKNSLNEIRDTISIK